MLEEDANDTIDVDAVDVMREEPAHREAAPHLATFTQRTGGQMIEQIFEPSAPRNHARLKLFTVAVQNAVKLFPSLAFPHMHEQS